MDNHTERGLLQPKQKGLVDCCLSLKSYPTLSLFNVYGSQKGTCADPQYGFLVPGPITFGANSELT